MIKVEEVFDVTKEKVEGVNPISKTPLEFTRTKFKANNIEFTGLGDNVERYINIIIIPEEFEIIEASLRDYDNEYGDDKDVKKVLKIMGENEVVSYAEKAFILDTFVGLHDCFCDFRYEEMVEFLGEDVSRILFKLVKEDDEDEE